MKSGPNIPDTDELYAAIIAANEGLSDAQSEAFLLRFALILANQIGDQKVLLEAVETARRMVAGER